MEFALALFAVGSLSAQDPLRSHQERRKHRGHQQSQNREAFYRKV